MKRNARWENFKPEGGDIIEKRIKDPCQSVDVAIDYAEWIFYEDRYVEHSRFVGISKIELGILRRHHRIINYCIQHRSSKKEGSRKELN